MNKSASEFCFRFVFIALLYQICSISAETIEIPKYTYSYSRTSENIDTIIVDKNYDYPLEKLILNDNNISDIRNVSVFKELKELQLGENTFETVDLNTFATMPELRVCYMWTGKIKNVINTDMSISQNSLEIIGFNHNQLTYINLDLLAVFPKLQQIYLDGNNLIQIDYQNFDAQFPSLDVLFITQNILECHAEQKLIEDLKSSGISFYHNDWKQEECEDFVCCSSVMDILENKSAQFYEFFSQKHPERVGTKSSKVFVNKILEIQATGADFSLQQIEEMLEPEMMDTKPETYLNLRTIDKLYTDYDDSDISETNEIQEQSTIEKSNEEESTSNDIDDSDEDNVIQEVEDEYISGDSSESSESSEENSVSNEDSSENQFDEKSITKDNSSNIVVKIDVQPVEEGKSNSNEQDSEESKENDDENKFTSGLIVWAVQNEIKAYLKKAIGGVERIVIDQIGSLQEIVEQSVEAKLTPIFEQQQKILELLAEIKLNQPAVNKDAGSNVMPIVFQHEKVRSTVSLDPVTFFEKLVSQNYQKKN